MKLKPLLLCAALILSSSANSAVIRFGYGALKGQPFAVGLGSFTISDIYNPTGHYAITAVDAEIGFLSGGAETYEHVDHLLLNEGESYFDAKTLQSPIGYFLKLIVGSGYGAIGLIDSNPPVFGLHGSPDSEINVVFAGELPQPTPTPTVPEPASWAMLIAGFGVIGGALRQRRRGSIRLA